jgi:hypothetical protein
MPAYVKAGRGIKGNRRSLSIEQKTHTDPHPCLHVRRRDQAHTTSLEWEN